jgi:branched-chain amino acid transport system ATP-binding protein
MTAALITHDLVKNFGGLTATDHVSLTIAKGARHALIGPNGAGKTTLINLLTGVLAPTSGRITLMGEDITAVPQNQRVKRGLVRTFQINQLFADLTPLQSLGLAISEREGHGSDWWRMAGTDRSVMAEAVDTLGRFGLADVLDTPTHFLPYGKQRLLEIALAFACKPQVLLLDEPAAGVPEEERHDIIRILKSLPADVTIVLIEHDMELVFSYADRITVLVNGGILTEGSVEEIAQDARVRTVYLGEDRHD